MTRMPMTETFTIAAEVAGKTTILRVSGELDAHTATTLREVLGRTLEASPISVVLDVGHVGFIDSTGLGAIVGARKRAEQLGSVVRLANPQPPVRRTLALFGLDQLVDD